jgi:hypothetical protein
MARRKESRQPRPVPSLKESPLKAQLRTLQCIGLTVWFSLGLLVLQFYLASSSYQLEAIANSGSSGSGGSSSNSSSLIHANSTDTGSGAAEGGSRAETYENLFAFMVPFGFIGLPVSGFVLDTRGFSANFCIANTLLVCMQVTSLIESLPLQVVTFVLWVLARFFLFSSYFAFLPAAFGFGTFGLVNGVISMVASVVGLLQYPLTISGDYTAINIGFLAILMLMYAFPVYLYQLEAKQMRAAANTDGAVSAHAETEASQSSSAVVIGRHSSALPLTDENLEAELGKT